ncbi:MAG: SMK killer toxin resistance protein [Sclerophora amabilis]|nr:MAG: SMK killer toxin resistance protein [Sclerophora amabilis]
MATFLTDLFGSIFTPGPTPTLLVATNLSFAGLQLVLGLLLFATHSIHFVVLSFLCAGLWWAINWFVTELQAANAREGKERRDGDGEGDGDRQRRRGVERRRGSPVGSGDDTETEAEAALTTGGEDVLLRPAPAQADVHKRRSVGEASGAEMSTEDEWEKVSEEGAKER